MEKRMTVKAFIARLAQYPEDALCCGTFWLADDFLSLDGSLTEATSMQRWSGRRTAMMRMTDLTGATCRRQSMR
jgi:hypothetical protein